MEKPNDPIRKFIKDKKIYSWQVSQQLKMHETTFYRLLRKELSEKEKQMIYEAIDELEKQREAQESQSAISG